MAIIKAHPKADLFRFLDNALEETERKAVEQHLETCKDCREHLSFVKEFNQELGELAEEEFSSNESCPD